MSWSTPATFVSGNVLTAAQLNVLTADLLETIPARAIQGLTKDPPYLGGPTFAPGVYGATGSHAITEMRPAQQTLNVSETTTFSSFTDLNTVGPSVNVTCNNLAIVFVNVAISADTTNTAATGIQISGATTQAPVNNGPSITGFVANSQITTCSLRSFAVNSGDNEFTLQYVVTTGTTGTFWRRHMTVWPF